MMAHNKNKMMAKAGALGKAGFMFGDTIENSAYSYVVETSDGGSESKSGKGPGPTFNQDGSVSPGQNQNGMMGKGGGGMGKQGGGGGGGIKTPMDAVKAAVGGSQNS